MNTTFYVISTLVTIITLAFTFYLSIAYQKSKLENDEEGKQAANTAMQIFEDRPSKSMKKGVSLHLVGSNQILLATARSATAPRITSDYDDARSTTSQLVPPCFFDFNTHKPSEGATANSVQPDRSVSAVLREPPQTMVPLPSQHGWNPANTRDVHLSMESKATSFTRTQECDSTATATRGNSKPQATIALPKSMIKSQRSTTTAQTGTATKGSHVQAADTLFSNDEGSVCEEASALNDIRERENSFEASGFNDNKEESYLTSFKQRACQNIHSERVKRTKFFFDPRDPFEEDSRQAAAVILRIFLSYLQVSVR